MTRHPQLPQSKPLRLHRPILFWLLALALIRGIIYASLMPPWQAPDEPAQFERVRASLTAVDWNSTSENGPGWYDDLIRSLFAFGFWDFLDDARPIYEPDAPLNRYIGPYQEIYGGLYGSRPTFALMGWPLFLVRNQDITLQLYLVRLNTVLMNVGIVGLAFLIVRAIFPQDMFLVVGVPSLVLFNPQHTHLLSTVNNGNLAELLTAAALYLMVKGIMEGFNWRIGSAVAGLSLVAMWTKATAYFLPVVIGCIALFQLWRYHRHWRWLLPIGLTIVGLIFYLVPQRLWLLMSEAQAGLRTGAIYLDPIVPLDLFRSFWAMPGWTIFLLPHFWYWILAAACLFALVGLTILLITRRHLFFSRKYQPQIQALVVLAIAAIVAISILLGWNALTQSITYRQGRSLYPASVPISLFLVLGWRQLIPYSWRAVALLLFTGLFFLFDTLVLFGFIVPFFYSRY